MDPEPDPAPFTWSSASRTDVGMVREVNEDACLDRPDIGLWAVADGMGGHAAGDVASRTTVEQLAQVTRQDRLSQLVDAAEERLLAANARLREFATRNDDQTIGSTVAVLLAHGRHAVCMWAGDSRIYRCRDGRLEQLTQDHAFVEDLVEQGVVSRDEAALHPQANLVTRAVGAADELYLDLEIVELRHDDTFILCSDGLDKEVRPEEMVEVLAGGDRQGLADALVELAIARGARDNVTVAVVSVAAAADAAVKGSPSEADGDGDEETTVPGMTASDAANTGSSSV